MTHSRLRSALTFHLEGNLPPALCSGAWKVHLMPLLWHLPQAGSPGTHSLAPGFEETCPRKRRPEEDQMPRQKMRTRRQRYLSFPLYFSSCSLILTGFQRKSKDKAWYLEAGWFLPEPPEGLPQKEGAAHTTEASGLRSQTAHRQCQGK